jgi:hypothetical protein
VLRGERRRNAAAIGDLEAGAPGVVGVLDDPEVAFAVGVDVEAPPETGHPPVEDSSPAHRFHPNIPTSGLWTTPTESAVNPSPSGGFTARR